MKLKRVTRKNKCRICGKADWCGFAPDGSFAVCMRVSSDKQTRGGGFIHSLEQGSKFKVQSSKFKVQDSKSDSLHPKTPAELNRIYSDFLQHLVLSLKHRNLLRMRGLSDLAVEIHGYKSIPGKIYSNHLAARLADIYDLRGVPGFYTERGSWRFVTYKDACGYLIPIRNVRHEIVALQLRRDDNQKPKYLLCSSTNLPGGTSSGTPPHFATVGQTRKYPSAESIIITEGVLKANIVSDLSGELVVGLVGVGTFNQSLINNLRECFPNLREVKIAFDADAGTNKAVKTQVERLLKLLKDSGLASKILTWHPEYKGMDDFLLSRREPVTKELRLADFPKLENEFIR